MDLPNRKSRKSQYHLLMIFGAVASFSILQLHSIWTEFSPLDAPETFFLPLPEIRLLATTLVATLIIFIVSFLAISAANQWRIYVLDCLVALVLFISLINPLTLNGLIFFERLTIFSFWEFSETQQNLILIGVILATSVGLILFVPRFFIRLFAVVYLLLLPYSVTKVASAIWTVTTYTADVIETKAKSKLNF